ncbi:HEPN domain-containing protein [Infirmifilum lucidum]|uniref:HEPN domain-containing protein n=1 Tax=Infirmifilum lucidum TaxID=2776706 RepID=A0A7L9FK44_9CREN|nr:HEPN domain-containing protein [Infirmifilum lucidum]QOJ79246.1 HEPN domain-containing protein [Infirmifilum lucidum]
MRDEALRWLSEAEWDYETATILHRERRYNAAAFYAHQSAEKAAKALLYYVNEAPWGHSIRVLLERYFAKTGINSDQELLSCARELDIHYVPSRYPNAHPAGTPHEAYDEEMSRTALEASMRILNFARRVIRGGRD